MTGSASDRDEEQTQETVPLELLPVHQGLEEDGSSWRATLPLAENLLRWVAVCPPNNARPTTRDVRPAIPASVSPAPQRRHRHRHAP
jgi:hypothetical protein